MENNESPDHSASSCEVFSFYTFHDGRSHELAPVSGRNAENPRPDSVQKILGNEADWLDRLVKKEARRLHPEHLDDLDQ